MCDVEDRLAGIVEGLVAFFGRGIRADVDVLAADADLLAVGFVDDTVDFFQPVRVGDDLVAGDEILI